MDVVSSRVVCFMATRDRFWGSSRDEEGNVHADEVQIAIICRFYIQGAPLSLMIQFANYKRFPVQPKEG